MLRFFGPSDKTGVVSDNDYFGPIVLKKSVDVADRIFSASWRRFPN